MRTAFFGSGAIGRTVLLALAEAGLAPALVVTQPPRRRRRRAEPEPTPVHAAADSLGIPVRTPADVNDDAVIAGLRAASCDLFLVAEYGQLLRRPFLDLPRLGTLNVHTSLLPRWRGAAPVAAAILAGDAETGVTIQRTVLKLDAGPILASRREPIRADDDRGTLSARLAVLGGALLVEVVQAFTAGTPPAERPQDEARATHCRRLTAQDTRVDWTRPAREIERLVRAYRPRPGARTALAREPELGVELRRVEVAAGAAPPGEVAAVGTGAFDVGSGADLVRVIELVPAARRAMSGGAFRNGYRLNVGERFR